MILEIFKSAIPKLMFMGMVVGQPGPQSAQLGELLKSVPDDLEQRIGVATLAKLRIKVSEFGDLAREDKWVMSLFESVKNAKRTNLPYHDYPHTIKNRIRDIYHDRLPEVNAGFVLDIGCSDGITTEELCDKYPQSAVIGSDINPILIAIARAKGKKGIYVLDDGYKSQFPDHSFDAVFSNNNLFNSIGRMTDEESQQAVGGMVKLVKESGFLAISGHSDWAYEFLVLRNDGKSFSVLHNMTLPIYGSQELFNRILEALGAPKFFC